MKILGINALGHDASVSVILNNDIVFAAHSERYSRKKNDEYLNDDLLNDALNFEKPDIICWYERPWIKKARQIMSGQWNEVVSITPSSYLAKFGLSGIPIKYYS